MPPAATTEHPDRRAEHMDEHALRAVWNRMTTAQQDQFMAHARDAVTTIKRLCEWFDNYAAAGADRAEAYANEGDQ